MGSEEGAINLVLRECRCQWQHSKLHCNGYIYPLLVPPVVNWGDCQLYPAIQKSSENTYLATADVTVM